MTQVTEPSIDPKQLRIGNKVYYAPFMLSKPIVATVQEIRVNEICFGNEDGTHAGRGPFNCFYGIPLTPEWLRLYGFEFSDQEEENGHYQMPIKSELGYQQFRSQDGKEIVLIDGDRTTVGIPCTYVHQFQNRYFSLTGEELTIKAPAQPA